MTYHEELQAFLRQAQEITAQVRAAGADMAAQEVTGACEGGAVQVTMTSGGDVRGVRIQPAALNPDNRTRLERQVAEAIQNALDNVRGVAQQTMQPFTEAFRGLNEK